MNILLESRVFHPSVGGLETSSELLAAAWQEMGHHVRIMTMTPLDGAEERDALDVVRQPSREEQWRLMRWSDAFVQSGISLRSLPVALLAGRPVVSVHRDFVKRGSGWQGLSSTLKQIAAHFLVKNVAVSRAVAAAGLPPATTVIHNAFRPEFDGSDILPHKPGERSGLLFVGRLVTEKGCDMAIEALAKLHAGGDKARLTVCGDGPERPALERLARQRGVEAHVDFTGWAEPSGLAHQYRSAEAVLMPSRNEPFGNVAVEALACGCPVVAARVGGLPEAVGPCGLLFAPDDAGAMAAQIAEMRKPNIRERLLLKAGEHLAKHRIEHVARRYLDVLEEVTA